MNEQDELTHQVIGAAIEVHRELGPGLLESVYQKCIEHELLLRNIAFEPRCPLPISYKGTALGNDLEVDLFFPGRLIVELKALERVLPIHEAQLLTYMRLGGIRLGLLINFNVPILRNGVKRFVL